MVTISSIKKFRHVPQNNFDLEVSEKEGALKNVNPAKFEFKIFNALISALAANTVIILATVSNLVNVSVPEPYMVNT